MAYVRERHFPLTGLGRIGLGATGQHCMDSVFGRTCVTLTCDPIGPETQEGGIPGSLGLPSYSCHGGPADAPTYFTTHPLSYDYCQLVCEGLVPDAGCFGHCVGPAQLTKPAATQPVYAAPAPTPAPSPIQQPVLTPTGTVLPTSPGGVQPIIMPAPAPVTQPALPAPGGGPPQQVNPCPSYYPFAVLQSDGSVKCQAVGEAGKIAVDVMPPGGSGGEATVTDSGYISTTPAAAVAAPSWFGQSSLFGLPNWALLAGGLAAGAGLYYAGGRRR